MATKKESELLQVDGLNLARTNRILRSLKMAQPIHPDCQHPRRDRWWVFCEERDHSPYISTQEREITTPEYGTDEDGDKILVGSKTKIKIVERPNLVQVPLDPSHNDGRGPENFARTKGFRQLEEIGYAPLCQLHDCWLPAVVNCEFGEYCSKEHARLVGAREEGIALEVLDRRKRRAQLRRVEID